MAAPVRRLSREAHRRRIHVRTRKTLRGTHGASAPLRSSLEPAHSRAGGGRSAGRTLASASSLDKEVRDQIKGGGNIAASKVVGKIIAERATRERASKKWYSTAAAINITAACRRLPKRPVRRA